MSRAVRRTYRLDSRGLEAVLRAADGRLTGTLTAGDDATDVDVGAHHGVLVFAIVQVLKVFPDLLEGTRSLHEGLDDVADEEAEAQHEAG